VSKKYPKLLNQKLNWIARQRLTRTSRAIGRQRLAASFGLVLRCIESGLDEDKAVLEAFRKAKLSHEDPFHWWELLHAFCSVHSRRPRTLQWNEKKKRQLVKDAVAAGRPGMSIRKICDEIKLRKPREWPQMSDNLQAQIARFGLTNEIHRKIKAKRC
jgi:hypothetical protein